MRNECFLDTNVLIYAASGSEHERRKFEVARDIVTTRDFCLSAQVLAEFCASAERVRPGGARLSPSELDRWLALLSDYEIAPVDSTIVVAGVLLSRRYRISYWDAAIVAAAERLGAPILYTEDLNHGQKYGAVTALNPFLAL